MINKSKKNLRKTLLFLIHQSKTQTEFGVSEEVMEIALHLQKEGYAHFALYLRPCAQFIRTTERGETLLTWRWLHSQTKILWQLLLALISGGILLIFQIASGYKL